MNRTSIKTILLIEDDPGDAFLIEEMLQDQECQEILHKVNRLSEGLDLLETNRYDVVLLDMNLPDSYGLSTLTRLRDLAADVPILILTGLSDEAFGIEAVRAGAQDYLVKGSIESRMLKRAIFYAIERKKLEVTLKQTRDLFEHQARIDFLTGIFNRQMFGELLEAELQRATRHGSELSLIMFDLDHFKQINDTYGHATGDAVLLAISGLVSDQIRAHDIFARWGGEEFMVLVPSSNEAQAQALAEKLRYLCEMHDFGSGLKVTASFGITQWVHDDDVQSFVNRADQALYLAKQTGRNRVTCLKCNAPA